MAENNRFAELIEYLKTNKIVRNQQEFVEKIGSDKATVSQIKNGKLPITNSMFAKIKNAFPNVSINWLQVGEGEMLLVEKLDESNNTPGGKLIPFYDDVSSIGGNNGLAANVQGVSHPTEYIDTGDWFRNATAAIRHYGESMVEYPPGCILALKEVEDRELIIPGRDYVIETSEYRVTKRVQSGKTKETITAYSTNTSTYADGHLIHEPFEIPWRAIVHISMVLGYVVKKNGGTVIYSNSKKI